jgi:hypothetical protein
MSNIMSPALIAPVAAASRMCFPEIAHERSRNGTAAGA